ncbi:fumarylacetoacetase [Bacillus sp. LL01]|uniref:fumarylacetoacetate hydrolase family protein n=1 Tax=Bacillus sp. LL01 TaxID=1665556 RepID=UPI00064D5B88|nr:fumarylacetoacetate hydrolase family protein [Bacillus sp. LL01]KMJ59592.1 fumarylacetoacetase [Bacillus sp. LL01]
MKYITFRKETGDIRAGWMDQNHVVDMNEASDGLLPSDLLTLINQFDKFKGIVELHCNSGSQKGRYSMDKVTLLAPIPRPVSVRDFYAFEEHVKTARARRGLDVVPEWYEIPVFYFTNHLAIKGHGELIEKPSACEWLDFELEIACIIGKEGRNIRATDAEAYIFGYCIMNDWSARDLQAKEMKVGLGPAKGKDFATSLGPAIVTPEELEPFKTGNGYNMKMTASVNGKLLSEGNFEHIHYTFAQMIERASADVTLYPGEVIGSGTVGSGCILELGTDVHRWLQPGDEVELSITGLGELKNTIK